MNPAFPPLIPRVPYHPHVLPPGPPGDPALACGPECLRRHMQALEAESRPHPDPDLERWRQAHQALVRLLGGWAEQAPLADGAMGRWFQDGPLVMRFPSEPLVLLEWSVLGYRAWRGDSTECERRLVHARFKKPELEALTRGVVAATATLHRVAAVEQGATLTLEPLLPAGPAVVVHDRGCAWLADVGSLLGARTYAAGPYAFVRPVAPQLPAHYEASVLARLAQAERRLGRSGDEPGNFLRDFPEELTHAVATELI